MRKILFIISVLFISVAFAQDNFDEVIYLKNGSILRGTIVEQIPNQTVKIQTKDGNVFVYNFSEVEKITKEESINKTRRLKDEPLRLKKGFTGMTELGVLFVPNIPFFSFNQVIGSRISQHYSIGLGVGIDVNRYLLFVPITLDNRIYFLKNNLTPFLNLAPGYALLTEGKGFNTHSFTAKYGMGVEYKVKEKIGVSFSIGARTFVSDGSFTRPYLNFGLTF